MFNLLNLLFFSSVNLATLALGYVSSSVLVCFTKSRNFNTCLCKVNQNIYGLCCAYCDKPQAATKCDSMTLTLGCWLGLPAVPAVTLYRHEDPSLVCSHPHSPFSTPWHFDSDHGVLPCSS